ncbi:phosphoadenosine phosphosulfate reductase domain-containing protein [Neptuniibacter pectenicola]|uniref:phosphoadenosine phosphosulfate reductase domain-containing protein n=1 Tax=Neptuniibacter pectenicola TaxID=1806669 RepID=UPI0008379C34|nr:phosphoadenosine phosphosulfate reductase family protein [Neptuniibacter pectenicola]
MKTHNIVSVSGGKDSTATLLLALERETENVRAVFADTGNEHQATYDYLDYLEEATCVEIERIVPDFSKQIEHKREVVKTKWVKDGVDDEIIQAALSVLKPTGNPFLDLCLWKGRFPSSKVRFCTTELKVFPIQQQIFEPLLAEMDTQDIYSWQGVRADESLSRANLPVEDEADNGVINYRPILDWSADEVFAFHDRHGIKPNPLYKQGMSRVGCMPCINVRKDELRQIVTRFPEEIKRIAKWEALVAAASKRGSATFKCAVDYPGVSKDDAISHTTHGIGMAAEWAMTVRGGRQLDLIASTADYKSCSSAYGLCE